MLSIIDFKSIDSVVKAINSAIDNGEFSITQDGFCRTWLHANGTGTRDVNSVNSASKNCAVRHFAIVHGQRLGHSWAFNPDA